MTTGQYVLRVVGGIIACVLVVALCVGGAAGCKSYQRYQKREDAKNTTRIVQQQVKTAHERTHVNKAQIPATQAEAEKRLAEAIGIRKSQDKISKTLTPLYVQHEAIQAQKALVNSPNHSQIYIPVGPSGVPLVRGTK